MARNVKPLLTILIDEDKRVQLREYAADKNVSMGWLINRLIDRVLIGDIDLFNDSLSIPQNREAIDTCSIGLDREAIELMIKNAIEMSNRSLIQEPIDNDAIERTVKSSIDSHQGLEKMTSAISLLQDEVKQLKNDVEGLMSIANIPALSTPEPQLEDKLEAELAPNSQGHGETDPGLPPTGSLTGDNKPQTVSWGKFHTYLGLEIPKDRNKANADIALKEAANQSINNYRYASGSNNFTLT